jgi:hypothetical protein
MHHGYLDAYVVYGLSALLVALIQLSAVLHNQAQPAFTRNFLFDFQPGFPFSILIHSRTDTRGFANAKFEPEFKPEGHFHYVSTDQLCLALAKST